MKYLLGLLLFLIPYTTQADVISLEEVSIDYKHYLDGSISPLVTQNLPDRAMDTGLNLNLNTKLFDVLYFDNVVHSISDKIASTGGNGQFRYIGWEYRYGLALTNNIDIGYYHFSEHLMDTEYKNGHFPVVNAIQLKIYLYQTKKRDSLLQ